MPTCVPIKDMKDTAEFTRKVNESSEPVIVTKNGYEAFIVMRPDDYEAMQQELAASRLLSRVAQAEKEYTSGDYSDGDEAVAAISEKYGL